MALFALLVAFLLSFLPMWVYAYIVYWFDRFEREPKRLLVVVFVWGALVAALGAALVEVLLSAGFLAATGSETLTELANNTVFAPIVEESLKGIAILIVALVFYSEFDSLLDGIVYGGIVALGFAATEDWFYLFAGYDEQGWGYMFGLFFVRVVLTGWNHAAFTAFTGLGIAFARLNPNVGIKILAPFGGWLIAVVLHAAFNALLSAENGGAVLLALCVSWLGWLAIFGIMLRAIAGERARAKKFLQDEVQQGVISPAQYRVATAALAPTFTRLGALGSGHFWDTRRFYQVCGELAQKKEQLAKFGDERGNTLLVEKLRAELARLAPLARA
jgi:RsiW-degrading membrane proteinase PrsW (M82 family)